MDTNIKTKPVRVLGFSLYLSERTAQDVLDANEFAGDNATSDGGFATDAAFMVYCAKVIRDSLKDSMKHKLWLNKKFQEKSLIATLRPKELLSLTDQILELEGSKKKVAEEEIQSAESSATSSSKKSSGTKTRKASQ